MSSPAATAGRPAATGPRSWAGIAPSVVWVMWRREMLRYSAKHYVALKERHRGS